MRNDNSYGEMQIIVFPNGDYYENNKYFDENGNIYKNEKIERKYNKSTTEIDESIDENGEKVVEIRKWEDDVRTASGAIDMTYYSINNQVVVERKDGIIYEYHKDGKFSYAYQVQEDGVMYYREDATKLRYEGEDGIKIFYYENGNISSIETSTTYMRYNKDYPNIISYASNRSEEEITIEVNGKEFKLGKNGHVTCYENGDTKEYYYDENTGYKYYESGDWEYEENGVVTKKDIYGNILAISDDKMYIGYHDYDENLISMISNRSEEEVVVEANGKEFKLTQSGHVSFYENGDTKEYNYDDNTRSVYYRDGSSSILKDGTWTDYNKDNEITSTRSGNNRTEYYDYEKGLVKSKRENGIYTSYYYDQQISQIENHNEEGVIVTVNDIYGNVYDLNNGDYAHFYSEGSFSNIKQGDILKKFYRNNNQEYYYIHDGSTDTYAFYHNDEILYTTDNPDSFEIVYKNGAQRVVLSDGTVIDPDIEEVIETTEIQTEEATIPSSFENIEEQENR